MTFADIGATVMNRDLLRLVTYLLTCALKCYHSGFPPLGVAIMTKFNDADTAARAADSYAFVKGPCELAVCVLLDEKGAGEFLRQWMTLAVPTEEESPWKRRRAQLPHDLRYLAQSQNLLFGGMLTLAITATSTSTRAAF